MSNYPNICRFFNEEVYKDIPQEKEYGFFFSLYQEDEVIIKYIENGKKVRESTPLKEITGWLTPWSINESLSFSRGGIDRTEMLLKNWYNTIAVLTPPQ